MSSVNVGCRELTLMYQNSDYSTSHAEELEESESLPAAYMRMHVTVW